MDNIHLYGSEAVGKAGSTIHSAAQTMQGAASLIDASLTAHITFMNDWMERFEAAVEKLAAVEQNRLPEGWKIW